ncbi:hypothetical protein [Aquimixticola soesokkakensis]|uniref:hypothetical protein n=1 Tax=Aquimixticola soesokkakensis TaxID=1519096 RepID=UPI0011775211|nr:hypothetical protein [Aquimixticola soesokkakensis]
MDADYPNTGVNLACRFTDLGGLAPETFQKSKWELGAIEGRARKIRNGLLDFNGVHKGSASVLLSSQAQIVEMGNGALLIFIATPYRASSTLVTEDLAAIHLYLRKVKHLCKVQKPIHILVDLWERSSPHRQKSGPISSMTAPRKIRGLTATEREAN